MIVIAPIRDAAMLAKQAATVHSFSGGRLTLGLATGARPDDYAATGKDLTTRGARFDAMLEAIRGAWEDGAIVPSAPRAPGRRRSSSAA